MINTIPDTTNVTPGMIGRLSIDSICSPPAKFHADGEYFIHAVHGLRGLVDRSEFQDRTVHRMGGLVYGDNDYDVAAKKGRVILAVGGGIDVRGQEKGVILAV